MPPPLEQVLMSRCNLRYREAHVICLEARKHLAMKSYEPWNEKLMEECMLRISSNKATFPTPKPRSAGTPKSGSISKTTTGKSGNSCASSAATAATATTTTTTTSNAKNHNYNTKKSRFTQRQQRKHQPINSAKLLKAKGPRNLRDNPSNEDLSDLLSAETRETQPKKFRKSKRNKRKPRRESASTLPTLPNINKPLLMKREINPLWPGSEHSANLMHSLHGLPMPPPPPLMDYNSSTPPRSPLQLRKGSSKSRSSRYWELDDDDEFGEEDVSFAIDEESILDLAIPHLPTNDSRSSCSSVKETASEDLTTKKNKTETKTKTKRVANFWTSRLLTCETDREDEDLIDVTASTDEMSDCSDPSFWRQRDNTLHTIFPGKEQQPANQVVIPRSSKPHDGNNTTKPNTTKSSQKHGNTTGITSDRNFNKSQSDKKSKTGASHPKKCQPEKETGISSTQPQPVKDHHSTVKSNAVSSRPEVLQSSQPDEKKSHCTYNRRGSTGGQKYYTAQQPVEDHRAAKPNACSPRPEALHSSPQKEKKSSGGYNRRAFTGGQHCYKGSAQSNNPLMSNTTAPKQIEEKGSKKDTSKKLTVCPYSLRPVGMHLWQPRTLERGGSSAGEDNIMHHRAKSTDEPENDNDCTSACSGLRPTGMHLWQPRAFNRRGSTGQEYAIHPAKSFESDDDSNTPTVNQGKPHNSLRPSGVHFWQPSESTGRPSNRRGSTGGNARWNTNIAQSDDESSTDGLNCGNAYRLRPVGQHLWQPSPKATTKATKAKGDPVFSRRGSTGQYLDKSLHSSGDESSDSTVRHSTVRRGGKRWWQADNNDNNPTKNQLQSKSKGDRVFYRRGSTGQYLDKSHQSSDDESNDSTVCHGGMHWWQQADNHGNHPTNSRLHTSRC